jgi:hypothetical protein
VKEMATFLGLWRFNPNAPWPTDPTETAKLQEIMFAGIDNNVTTGETLEFGCFPNARSGYAISTGQAKDMFKQVSSFYSFVEVDVQEIVPWETTKEIMREVTKAQAEA